PVADGAVGAGRPVDDRRVLAPEDRIAGVGRAGVPVVAVQGDAPAAGAAQTRLGAVADGAVRAAGPVRHRRVGAAGGGGAGLRGTRIAVVGGERRACRARPG